MTDRTLRDVIRAFDEAGPDEPVIRKVLEAILKEPKKDALTLLWPVVADEVRRVRRLHVHAIERDYDSSRTGTPREGIDPLAARKKMLAESFICPGFDEPALWADATIEQHAARAEYLRKLVGGITSTIDRHERAIADIEAAGVECLGDLEDAAA